VVERPTSPRNVVGTSSTGDPDGRGGGHRHGTGKPGRTEFPARWSDDQIISNVDDVAEHPDNVVPSNQGRPWYVGVRDGVAITAVVNRRDNSVRTAWPDAGSPGVVSNPKEKL
jgi:hypothetical protein